MNTHVIGLAEQSKAMTYAEQSAAVLKHMRILDADFDPAQVDSIGDLVPNMVTNMGDRLYAHAYDFQSGCIEKDGDYAELFCALVQHAGLVKEFADVESSLDKDSGSANIRCVSGSVTFSSQWKQAGSSVEEEFFSFTNAAFDAVGGKMHVQLPMRDQGGSMICVNSQHFVALDAMLRAVEACKRS